MPKSRPKRRKAVPTFRSEDEERALWATADATDYFDWSQAEPVVFPNLKPSTATISLRLPQGMLDELKVLANQRDEPYQSLLKVFLAERLSAERHRARRASA
ncbi:MAG: BrnA antitoxin family protein [Gemmatimonadaceae bacterium]|nr:BrnA antitoxin family protein [Gemmatimonadaceae bacterium]